MLAMVIEDTKNNTWSELNFNKYDNSYNGFSICNGVISPFNKDYLGVFKYFILSDMREKVDSIDGYDVILDKKSGLYHFFKDGKEDLEKLILYNSEDACLYVGDTLNDNPLFRKITLSFLCLVLTFEYSYVIKNISEVINVLSQQEDAIVYNDDIIYIVENKIFDTISYTYDGIEDKFRGDIKSKQIKDLIYSSENLNQIEKDFLWKPELIDMVIPYYHDTNFEIISLVRHTNIGIESFGNEYEESWNGFYSHDNILHIRDYDFENIEEGNDQCRVMGHEYIHLLQVPSCPKFIKEASAELMSHEFYLNSSDLSKPFAYFEACNYLKALMETVGPDVIIESNFKLDSSALSDAVKDYFTESEYQEFFEIMNLSPFHDYDKLVNGKFQRLSELLNILYINKYGSDISNDVVIKAIFNGEAYNRVYFNDNLRSREEYISVYKDYSFEEAMGKGLMYISLKMEVSKEEYDSENGPVIKDEIISINTLNIENKIDNFKAVSLVGRGCRVVLQDDSELYFDESEALELGFINVKYYVLRRINYDIYKQIKNTEMADNLGINADLGCRLDSENEILYVLNDFEKLVIDSLPLKFSSMQSKLA